MTTPSRTSPTDPQGEFIPEWVRRVWAVPLVLGVLIAVFGLILLFNLGTSLATLRWLVFFGMVAAAVEAFVTAGSRHRPWVGYLVGALLVGGAIVTVVWPKITLVALAVVFGVTLLVGGALQIAVAVAERHEASGWGWALTAGILSALAGVILLASSPALTLLVMAIILAVRVLLAGLSLIVLAFGLRRELHAPPGLTPRYP